MKAIHNTNKQMIFHFLLFLISKIAKNESNSQLTGCKPTTRIVEVPIMKKEYKDKILRDSVYLTDSITIFQKGDPVFNTKTRYLFKYKFEKDTVSIIDTITVVKVEEIPIVTNELNTFQRFSIRGFWSIIVILMGFIIMKRRLFFGFLVY